MEHHKLAQLAMIVCVIFLSITSPVLAGIMIYFYFIGWFTNKNEHARFKTFSNYLKIVGLKTPEALYNWGLLNIIMQFVVAWTAVNFAWAIIILVTFSIGLFLGVSSTEENLKKIIGFMKNWRIGRVW